MALIQTKTGRLIAPEACFCKIFFLITIIRFREIRLKRGFRIAATKYRQVGITYCNASVVFQITSDTIAGEAKPLTWL